MVSPKLRYKLQIMTMGQAVHIKKRLKSVHSRAVRWGRNPFFGAMDIGPKRGGWSLKSLENQWLWRVRTVGSPQWIKQPLRAPKLIPFWALWNSEDARKDPHKLARVSIVLHCDRSLHSEHWGREAHTCVRFQQDHPTEKDKVKKPQSPR